MKRLMFISLFLVISMLLSAQETKVIFGKLIVFNEYPVSNVKVTAKKAGTQVTSDEFGEFAIVAREKDIIQLKPKGFDPVSIRVNDKTDFLHLNLIFKDSEKNRQLATGMGYVTAEQLSYGLEHLANQNNDFCNYDNIFSLIRGKFPGVSVMDNGKGDMGVFMRGPKSLTQSNEALYVINGIPTDAMPNLNPCDISSLNILKEGASALYGNRGANGVVVIETK